MSEEKTKKCPYCSEDILATAIKCKHCKSDLVEKEKELKTAKERDGMEKILKTIEFGVSPKEQIRMNKELEELKKDGWEEISRSSKIGKYKGNKGCCLFFIGSFRGFFAFCCLRCFLCCFLGFLYVFSCLRCFFLVCFCCFFFLFCEQFVFF